MLFRSAPGVKSCAIFLRYIIASFIYCWGFQVLKGYISR